MYIYIYLPSAPGVVVLPCGDQLSIRLALHNGCGQTISKHWPLVMIGVWGWGYIFIWCIYLYGDIDLYGDGDIYLYGD